MRPTPATSRPTRPPARRSAWPRSRWGPRSRWTRSSPSDAARQPALEGPSPGFGRSAGGAVSQLSAIDVQAARPAVEGVARRTPVLSTRTFSERAGGTVLVEAVGLQRTGSIYVAL